MDEIIYYVYVPPKSNIMVIHIFCNGKISVHFNILLKKLAMHICMQS